MLRAVLFDLDDTLVDQKTASHAAVVAWAAELGVTSPEVAQRWAAISAVHYARYGRRELSIAQQPRERVREFLDVEISDPEADAVFAGYLEGYEAGWTVFEDAVPALRRARAAGLAVAVLTTATRRINASRSTGCPWRARSTSWLRRRHCPLEGRIRAPS